MKRQHRWLKGQRLFALGFIGFIMFNFPLIYIFSEAGVLGNIPLLYVYVFGVWLMLIVGLALIVERKR